MSPAPPKRRWLVVRLVALVVIIAATVVTGLIVGLPDQQQLKTFADEAGWIGGVIFIVGYALVTLTPLPASAVSIAAGFVWGFGWGSLLGYLGALLGATVSFAIGRALGREAVEQFTGTRVARIDDLLRRRGMLSVMGARLIPVLPFTVVNYTASLTAVSRRDYAIGTAIGIIPGSLAYVAIGAFALDPGPVLFIAIGVLVALAGCGALLAWRSRRSAARRTESETP